MSCDNNCNQGRDCTCAAAEGRDLAELCLDLLQVLLALFALACTVFTVFSLIGFFWSNS